MTVKKVLDFLNDFAPLSLQEEWDNSGLLIGDENNVISNVLLALDVTNDVIDEAISKKCNLIITHHPVIFTPMRKIITSSVLGVRLSKLIKNDISVISMHTNLDKVVLNALLLKTLGVLKVVDEFDYLHTGLLTNEISCPNLADQLKKVLKLDGIRYYDSSVLCRKIGCVSGSGGEFLSKAIEAGCDTFITGDIKHNIWLEAKDAGINLIDIEHFNSENIVIPYLCTALQKRFSDDYFIVADSNQQVIKHG